METCSSSTSKVGRRVRIVLCAACACAVLVGAAAVGVAGDPALAGARPTQQGLAVIGQVGGPTRAVAAAGDTLYAGRGPRVIAFAACRPGAPIAVGQSTWLPGPVLDLLVAEPYLYATLGPAGLAVLDITARWEPRLLRVVPLYGVSARLVPEGDRLYVVSGYGGLRILTTEDPAAPRELGHFQAVVSDVAVRGSFAYAVKRDFTVVDVSDPTAPRQLRKLADWADSVALQGTTMVVAVSSSSGGSSREAALQAFDVSDPAMPRARGSLPIGPPARLLRFAEGLLVAFQPEGARVVDVSDIDDLRDVATFPARGTITGAAGIVGAGGLHLLLAAGPYGLRSVDLGRPDDPSYDGEVWSDAPLADAQAVAAADGIAYVEDEGADGRVRVYDLRVPERPHELGSLPLTVAHGAIAAAGGRLVVGTPDRALAVADVTDPGRSTIVSRLGLPEPIWGLDLVGDRVVVANDETVRVIDVSHAEAPRDVGAARASGGATAVTVAGGKAYVTGPATGLETGRPSLMAFELPPGMPPREVGAMPDAGGWRHGLASRPGTVYIDGLQVVDVSSPGAMREVGRLTLEGEARALAVAGDRLYGAMRLPGGGRLVELDLGAASVPVERATLDLVDEALDVAVWHGYALVAAKEAGLIVVRTDGAAPPPTPRPPEGLPEVVYLPVAAVGPVGLPCRPPAP